MHMSIEKSCANDGEHTENNKHCQIGQTFCSTSSCQLPHGLPWVSENFFRKHSLMALV